jgi:hypothetical protein
MGVAGHAANKDLKKQREVSRPMPYGAARALIRSTTFEGRPITSAAQFVAWAKSEARPAAFPTNPWQVYKKQWRGFTSFLRRSLRTFEEARAFIRSVSFNGKAITCQNDFAAWASSGERPDDFPANPWTTYEGEWKGLGDFLGTNAIPPSRLGSLWPSLDELRRRVRAARSPEGLPILSEQQYRAWARTERAAGRAVPTYPDKVYAAREYPAAVDGMDRRRLGGMGYRPDGIWRGWEDLLGEDSFLGIRSRGVIQGKLLPYERAREVIRELQEAGVSIFTRREYLAWRAGPDGRADMPSSPYIAYEGIGWKSFGEFLGTNHLEGNRQKFLSYEQARAVVAKARAEGHKISTKAEYHAWHSATRPHGMPSQPHVTYGRDGSWRGYPNFFGPGAKRSSPLQNAPDYARARELVAGARLSDGRAVSGQPTYLLWQRENRHLGLPSHPNQHYRDGGWTCWADFLSAETKDHEAVSSAAGRAA